MENEEFKVVYAYNPKKEVRNVLKHLDRKSFSCIFEGCDNLAQYEVFIQNITLLDDAEAYYLCEKHKQKLDKFVGVK